MNDARLYVRPNPQTFSVIDYYSTTFDVLAIDESHGEEDPRIDIVATFKTENDARAFVENDKSGRYIIGVRPPAGLVRTALAWLNLNAQAYAPEGTPINRR